MSASGVVAAIAVSSILSWKSSSSSSSSVELPKHLSPGIGEIGGVEYEGRLSEATESACEELSSCIIKGVSNAASIRLILLLPPPKESRSPSSSLVSLKTRLLKSLDNEVVDFEGKFITSLGMEVVVDAGDAALDSV